MNNWIWQWIWHLRLKGQILWKAQTSKAPYCRIDNPNSTIAIKKKRKGFLVENFGTIISPGPGDFAGEFYKYLKRK